MLNITPTQLLADFWTSGSFLHTIPLQNTPSFPLRPEDWTREE